MFEKILEVLERIAVALERSAAYANTAPKSTAAPAGKSQTADKPKEDAAPVVRKNGKVVEPSSAADGDGLGDDPVTFEQMREKLIAVKGHPKLGPTKSSAIFAEYGKLPDIKEPKYAEVLAKCEKLLKSVA